MLMAAIRTHNVVEANREKGTWAPLDTANREVSKTCEVPSWFPPNLLGLPQVYGIAQEYNGLFQKKTWGRFLPSLFLLAAGKSLPHFPDVLTLRLERHDFRHPQTYIRQCEDTVIR